MINEKSYRCRILSWRKKIFLYVLVVVAILWCPFTIRLGLNTEKVVNKVLPIILSQLPTITINNGIASTTPAKVYNLYYPGMPYKFAIIDTSGQYQKFDNDEAILYIGKTAAILKMNHDKKNIYSYQKNHHQVINSQTIQANIETHKNKIYLLYVIMMYTLGLLIAYALYLIYLSILGVITSIIAGSMDRELSYYQNLTLTAIAATPVALIWSLLYLVGWMSLPVAAIGLLIQIACLIGGVFACQSLLKISVENKK